MRWDAAGLTTSMQAYSRRLEKQNKLYLQLRKTETSMMSANKCLI